MRAIAFHITWGTYGTRLHGDPRGTVLRAQNTPGTPILEHDPKLWDDSKARLRYPPVRLTREQMVFIEATIPDLCGRGFWTLHACAAGPDHVHVVLATQHDPDTARRLLKRWLGQAMSEQWDLGDGPDRTWWAEGGSTKPICDEVYLENAVRYVLRQRATHL